MRVIRQRDAAEGGAVCLAMVLAYFGKRYMVSQCRAACDPDRDGITSADLLDAAAMLGLCAEDWVVQGADSFDSLLLHLPAIVLWRGRHFVVVERITPRHVTIVDPASGRRRLTRGAFDRCCSGVALTFADNDDANAAACVAQGWFGPVRSLLCEFRELPQATWMVSLLIVSTILLQICGLALPVGLLLVVDRILPVGIEPPLILIASAGLLVALSHTMLRFVRSQVLTHLSLSVEAHGGVAGWVMVACLDGWFVISSWLLMVVWSPVLAALAGGLGLLQICLVMGASRRLRREVQREVAAEAEMQAWGAEVLRGSTDVKALGREAYAIERWSMLAERRGELSESRQRVGSMVEAVISGMGLCSLLGLLVLGAHEVLAERLALGAMLALNALAGGALIPLGEMTRSLQRFLMARARLEPLRDALNAPVDRQPAKALDAPAGAVRVERLCFRYQHGGPLVLDDVSFAAEAGALVAIVGRAGSGKSTLARLLAGVLTPTSGRVSLDRWPLSVAEQRRAREQCGVVLQDSPLFNLTIRENIAFGRVDLSFEQIMRAAKVAAVHDEIMRMPLGYDTPVLGGGNGLSGSERQRLLIARAVAHRPALLILDEAMNQLDMEIEHRVASNLVELSCTRIVVGHRVSMVRDADLVLVLDRGRVVEQGAPEMLLRHRGLFTGLSAPPWSRECEEWR